MEVGQFRVCSQNLNHSPVRMEDVRGYISPEELNPGEMTFASAAAAHGRSAVG